MGKFLTNLTIHQNFIPMICRELINHFGIKIFTLARDVLIPMSLFLFSYFAHKTMVVNLLISYLSIKLVYLLL